MRVNVRDTAQDGSEWSRSPSCVCGYGPPTEQLALLVVPEEKTACLLHGRLEAECAHVDVRQPFLAALGVQLMAPL